MQNGWKIAAHSAAEQLASFLQKSKAEMYHMLLRTNYMGEKKKAKQTYEKGL